MTLIEEAKEGLALSKKQINEELGTSSNLEHVAALSGTIAASCAYYTLALQLADPVELADGIIHSLENEMNVEGLANIVAKATEAMERLENMERN